MTSWPHSYNHHIAYLTVQFWVPRSQKSQTLRKVAEFLPNAYMRDNHHITLFCWEGKKGLIYWVAVMEQFGR